MQSPILALKLPNSLFSDLWYSRIIITIFKIIAVIIYYKEK